MSLITQSKTPASDKVIENGAKSKDECTDDSLELLLENATLCEGEHKQVASYSQGYMKALTAIALSTSKRGPKFYCYSCDYYLHTHLSMITHMKMHRKPFCPICFGMFENEGDLRAHISEFHSTIHPDGGVPSSGSTENPASHDEDVFHQTEAPPNSPNHEMHDPDGGDINATNSIPQLLAEKLLEHQKAIGGAKDSKSRVASPRTRMQNPHSPPEEPIRAPTLRNRRSKEETRSPMVGKSGRVQKPTKPKASEHMETVMKRVTSRFGRCITLKVPQY